MRCEVDYALGGGGSGGETWEGGARTVSGATEDGTSCGARGDSSTDAIASGAHGIIDSQSPGTNGASQDVCWCEVLSPDCCATALGISIPAMSMPAIPAAGACAAGMGGIAHAKPLPTHKT